MGDYLDEYALNTFSDVWHKDPFRLFDLGNDIQLLYDKVTGNKTGETDRAERNILHAMGEPYKPGEIFFNVATNIAPTALSVLGGAMLGGNWNKIAKLARVYKPYAFVPSKLGMTTKQALKMAASTVSESTGKNLGKGALKGAILGVTDAPGIKSFGYGSTRPISYKNSSKWKSMVLAALNADIEDPARFNEADVKLAYGAIFGKDELIRALNENIRPRDMVSRIRATAKEHPDKMAECRARFIKAKAEYNAKKDEQ